MSMLKTFFEIGTDTSLFDGLEISKETELCETYMGRFPVVSVSLKEIEGADFASARSMMVDVINEEARRLYFLAESEKLTEIEKKVFLRLLEKNMDDAVLNSSLKVFTEMLEKHYGKKAILLIDEYDVPLAKASQRGYYKNMIQLVRSMFHKALKTNNSLYFAVMTGCLRVSKESIFTGLNNLKMYTLLDARSGEQFGFTDEEVREMLAYYGLTGYYDLTREWYDGYQIGQKNVYNPWDVVNWCDQLLTDTNKTPKSYWTNSSGNEELKKFISSMGNGVTKAEIEKLISGASVQKRIEEQLTYDSMYDTIENMWSLLFATGYLTQAEIPDGNYVWLVIPNTEVRNIFRDSILRLFEKKIADDGTAVEAFCTALKGGQAAEAEKLFTELMRNTISIRDTSVKKEFKESFYHGILLGVLSYKENWGVASNRESGEGYYDIAIEIEDEEIGMIIEVKYAEKEDFEGECKKALKQINDKGYTEELKEDGMQILLKYGIACNKKNCRIMLEQEGSALR